MPVDKRILNAMNDGYEEPKVFELKDEAAAKAMRERFYRARVRLEQEDPEMFAIASTLSFVVRGSTFIIERNDPLSALG